MQHTGSDAPLPFRAIPPTGDAGWIARCSCSRHNSLLLEDKTHEIAARPRTERAPLSTLENLIVGILAMMAVVWITVDLQALFPPIGNLSVAQSLVESYVPHQLALPRIACMIDTATVIGSVPGEATVSRMSKSPS